MSEKYWYRRGFGLKNLVPDLVAGLSVALVLVPQSLAYAELAGLPSYTGLYAAATPAIAAAIFASSPYLQTGPTAMTSLLTLGALATLATPGTSQSAALAVLLALVVGVIRLLLGLLHVGAAAYLLSQTVMMGFTSGAAILIVTSQLPTALGARLVPEGVLEGALGVAINPRAWELPSMLLSVMTLVVVFVGRRIHRFFPGVLVAVVLGTAYSVLTGYAGSTVGSVPAGLPVLSMTLPWSALPVLLVPGLVIAVVGFAEPTSIARTYAAMDRSPWNPNRELVSQGVANLAAGVSGGLPVGGSFSRSALDRASGARTRWSGAVTGAAVLAFLPFATLLSPLPKAVLAAIVISAVVQLVRPGPIWQLWHYSRPQFAIAIVTLLLTLGLSPRIDRAVMLGLLLAVMVHLWRELHLETQAWYEEGVLHLRPMGVLWFGTANTLEENFLNLLSGYREARRVTVHLDGLGRMDLTGALALRSFCTDVHKSGLEVEFADIPPQSRRLVESVLTGSTRVVG